jgi:hypothetical protein
VVAYTPSTAGNFHIGLYFRVVTATTTVTITVTWTDAGGAQNLSILDAVPATVAGSPYSFVDFMIDSVAGEPITISFTAGTSNQVYASASILQG